jgi:nucleotide-binding universal stress UspA family protein
MSFRTGTVDVMAARLRTILVGYDDSEAARRALDRAADLAGYGSHLTVVSVERDEGPMLGAVLDNARMRLIERHVPATYLQPGGEPADAIVAAAEEIAADLVVVGRRSHGPLRRSELGSVSAAVARRAPCEVLVVP